MKGKEKLLGEKEIALNGLENVDAQRGQACSVSEER